MGVDNSASKYSVRMLRYPPVRKLGDVVAHLPEKMVRTNHELALTHRLIYDQRLFGSICQNLIADYWGNYSPNSGLMIRPIVPISDLIASATFPGDIDLLVIPFTGDRLLISDTVAIELKVVRASFLKQNKAPNSYGFSQSLSLLNHGFSFVAVVHLIVSNSSPEKELIPLFELEDGVLSEVDTIQYDPMPASLVRRCFGRLVKNSPDSRLGLAAAYIEEDVWRMPLGKEVIRNERASFELFESLASYYHQNSNSFLKATKC